MECHSFINKSSSNNNFLTFFVFTILLTFMISQVSCTFSQSTNYTNFIIKSCSNTTYPPLCLKYLTPYAGSVKSNPQKLSKVALTVAITGANNCSVTVSKLVNQKGLTRPEARAIKDCIGNMKDVVYELKQTVSAITKLSGKDRKFLWANAKTYASAAITDAETCIDGVLERRVNLIVKNKIRSCVNGVEKLISNALYLINHLY